MLHSIEDSEFHNLVQLSETRWLARHDVVKVLLEHFSTLKIHFNIMVNGRKCYTARVLREMFDDPSNYLYLTFAKPILYEIDRVNLYFQRENVDISAAYDELKQLILFVAQKILKPNYFTNNLKDLADVLQMKEAHVTVMS